MKNEHVEATEEKFPLPTPKGEYIEDFEEKPSSLEPPQEGEYVEEEDDDEKPVTLTKENEGIEINDIYKNELYKEIENLSVNDELADQDSTGLDERTTCGNCGIGFRDLRKHKRIEKCSILPFPHARSNRKSRE